MKKLFLLLATLCYAASLSAQATEGIRMESTPVYTVTFWTDDPAAVNSTIYVGGIRKGRILNNLSSQQIDMFEGGGRQVIRVVYPNGTDREINFYHGEIDKENKTALLYAGKQKTLSGKTTHSDPRKSSSSVSTSSSKSSGSSNYSSAPSVGNALSDLNVSSELGGVIGVVGGLVAVGALIANSEPEPTENEVFDKWKLEYDMKQSAEKRQNVRETKGILSSILQNADTVSE